ARGTLAETIAAVLERPPDWAGLPAGLPVSVRYLLEHCLEKDPKHRLRDIGDVRRDLEIPTQVADHVQTRWSQASIAWATPVGIGLVALGIMVAKSWRQPGPALPLRLPIELGRDAMLPGEGNADTSGTILSSDGLRLVYRAQGPTGQVQLFLRS